MSFNQFPNRFGPPPQLLSEQLSALPKCGLMRVRANQPLLLGFRGCLAEQMKVISAEANTGARQKDEAECDRFGRKLHGVRSSLRFYSANCGLIAFTLLTVNPRKWSVQSIIIP